MYTWEVGPVFNCCEDDVAKGVTIVTIVYQHLINTFLRYLIKIVMMIATCYATASFVRPFVLV